MMKRTLAAIAIVASVGLLTGGLIFLCSSGAYVEQEPSRSVVQILVAGVLLVSGGGLAAWGALTLRRLRDLAPENLSDRITQLVQGGDGEITLAQVVARLRVPDEAAVAALNVLERRGQARREHVGDEGLEVYVFPGLRPRLVRRRCPYCGTEFSVKKALNKCPHCGGNLSLDRE
jgi:hypothetical protein